MYAKTASEYAQVGDIRVAYRRIGRGKPILFISGTSQTKEAWEPSVVAHLAATGHEVIIFDNRGMGETDVGMKPFSLRQFAADAVGLLDALHIERADILGG